MNGIHKSALEIHVHNTSHHICMGDAKLIVKEEYYTKIRIWEALYIERQINTLNRDEGLKLSYTCRPIIKHLKQ